MRGELLFTKAFYMWSHRRLGYLVDERYLGRFSAGRPCLPRDFTFLIFGPFAGVRLAFGKDAGRRGGAAASRLPGEVEVGMGSRGRDGATTWRSGL